MAKFFKLDSNIDGHYIDYNGDEQVIKNFIQVVSGVDGSSVTPNVYGQVSDIENVDDLTAITSISGRGILYSSEGKIVGKKGDLIIRDVDNNQFSINTITYKTIKENDDLSSYLRDQSLVNVTNNSDIFLDLNNLIKGAKQNVLSPGNGNIIQFGRRDISNNSEIYLRTVPISSENKVIISGKVIVSQECVAELVDAPEGTQETVLASVYLSPRSSAIKPLYINWGGILPQYNITNPDTYFIESQTVDEDFERENKIIYNNFLKKHFQKTEDSTGQVNSIYFKHKVVLRIKTGTFLQASLNMMVSDTTPYEQIERGTINVQNQLTSDVRFSNVFPASDYSIVLSTSIPVKTWYSQKSADGFIINYNRAFMGKLYWTAIYNSVKI
jgi:hypothetical protein